MTNMVSRREDNKNTKSANHQKLLVVTDLGLLKAYRLTTTPRGTPRLELMETVELQEAHHRLVEKVTDLAGRHASPTLRQWGTPLADDHNLKLEAKRRLIKQIARHLQRLLRRHARDDCWLVAQKEIGRLVLQQLPSALRHRVEKTVARDLVKADGPTLLRSLRIRPLPTGTAAS